jgi:diaminopropionate ammonia-lyase
MSAHMFHNRDLRNRANPPGSSTDRASLAFHQRLDGYAPTPLRRAPELARTLRVGQVLLKDESSRLGLPAFKILGASWAIYRALEFRVRGGLTHSPTTDRISLEGAR